MRCGWGALRVLPRRSSASFQTSRYALSASFFPPHLRRLGEAEDEFVVVLHFLVRVLGHEDLAAVGQRFHPGGYVHHVAEHVLLFDDAETSVKPDTHVDLLARCPAGVILPQLLLDLQGGPYPVGGILVKRHGRIADGLDQDAPVLTDDRQDELVVAVYHEPAVEVPALFIKRGGTLDVGEHDRYLPGKLRLQDLVQFDPFGQDAFDVLFLFFHGVSSSG